MSAMKFVIRGGSFLCTNGVKSLAAARSPALWEPLYLSAQMPLRYVATKEDVEKTIKDYEAGKFDTISDPSRLDHFKGGETSKMPEADRLDHFRSPLARVMDPLKELLTSPQYSILSVGQAKNQEVDTENATIPPVGTFVMPHPIWKDSQLYKVQITHKPPECLIDTMAYYNVQLMRHIFDLFSGFRFGDRNERKWLNRISFLETVAGVPGMVAAMLRHMKSLRRLQRDFGWIHTLLEEAENERMHLLTALELKKPSTLFKMAVIGSQGVFVTWFGLCYMISPRFCHRFVGYLEEEAVKTYSKCLQDIDADNGPLAHWRVQGAPDVAIRYWKLKEDATMKDVILAIRADEAHHRIVNHTLASMKTDQFNPYKPGE